MLYSNDFLEHLPINHHCLFKCLLILIRLWLLLFLLFGSFMWSSLEQRRKIERLSQLPLLLVFIVLILIGFIWLLNIRGIISNSQSVKQLNFFSLFWQCIQKLLLIFLILFLFFYNILCNFLNTLTKFNQLATHILSSWPIRIRQSEIIHRIKPFLHDTSQCIVVAISFYPQVQQPLNGYNPIPFIRWIFTSKINVTNSCFNSKIINVPIS